MSLIVYGKPEFKDYWLAAREKYKQDRQDFRDALRQRLFKERVESEDDA